jgi:uncharacterized membrane protein YdjX (TVP38/TMEM64 family)
MRWEQSRVWKPVVKVLGVSFVLILLTRFLGVHDLLHVDRLPFFASLTGWKGILILLLVGSITPLAFVPRWPLAVICGIAYGMVYGSLVASLAGLLGAAFHYKLAAWIITDRDRTLFENMAWFRKLEHTQYPFQFILALRLFPLSNFSATNLVCGLLRIPFGCYLGASFLGMLPSTIVFVMAGKGLFDKNMQVVAWMLALSALLALLPVLRNVLRAPIPIKEPQQSKLDEGRVRSP